ncbi:MAG TPA: ROK family protein [bacterium]|nr:ROK family protein [bacterium]
MKKLYVGVDLGGTNVRSGLADEEGNILSRDKRKSLPRVSAEAPVKQIVDSITEVVRQGGITFSDIQRVGIGSPGPLSAKEGKILKAGNLPHWVNFPLAAVIKERVGVDVCLQNDANLFAYGEWWKGAGKGFDDFFALTLGTGIGGGAVCGGKLLTGFNDNASEIGHTSIDYNGPQCWCGQRGCLELYSSATGIVRLTKDALVNEHVKSSLEIFRDKPDELTSKIIFEAANSGDEFAKSMFDKAGYLLGLGIVNALNFLNFQRVAIGGGLAESGDFIFEPARRALSDRGFSSYNHLVSIVPAAIPNEAGILGAVKMVIDMEVGS